MSYRCLADFLESLGHAGELVRVEAEVDPAMEAAEITSRVSRRDGPALLFAAPAGSRIPLVTNLLGSETRICQALGVSSLIAVVERMTILAEPGEPEGWFEKLKTPAHAAALAKLCPRQVKSGACQQIVRLGSDVDLGEFPALRSAQEESNRAITAGVLLTADPDTHRPVAGRWDLPIVDRTRLAISWADDEEPARLLLEYGRRGENMPIAVALGGDPAVLLAAMAPVPPAVDVVALAGLFREKPIDVLPCRKVDLAVPADAEIVIEGHIAPGETPLTIGPLCMPSGHYGRPRPMPAMHVTAVTHRANPIFPALVSDRPPHEAGVVARALGRMLLPLVKLSIGELVDFDLPMFGAARNVAVISLRKTYAGQTRRVAEAAWGLPVFRRARCLVLVDQDVDVRDQAAVLSAIANHAHPVRDLILHQCPPDPLDHATLPGELSQQVAIDATQKLPGEHAATWPSQAARGEDTRRLVDDRWPEYGLGPA